MDVESLQQARWLSVYGASIALQAQRMNVEHGRDPTPDDVAHFNREAIRLANMVVAVNGDPKR